MKSIALIGKPNAGKSLLFNRLTGMKQKVSNFPGITSQIKKAQKGEMEFIDFPGFYSLSALTMDESVAVEHFYSLLEKKQITAVVCVLDINQLKASLQVAIEVKNKALAYQTPVIFALNMIDEVANPDPSVWENLQQDLQSPVVALSAKTGQGLNQLLDLLRVQIKPSDTKQVEAQAEALRLSNLYSPAPSATQQRTRRLDQIFLSPVGGIVAFLMVMTILFQAIFTFSVPFMDSIETLISWLAEQSVQRLPDGAIKDFVVDALFGGIGSFLVFIPQIFFLTFIIGLLEDSGYLARAAMLCHRPLRFFGLSGKSFIPILTGHACAIPAIFATRMIDSPKRRLMTLFIVPLMGCSARLPVYAFLCAAVIPPKTYLGGLVGLQGLALLSMYILGLVVALMVSWFLSRLNWSHYEDTPFVLELPSYRNPHWKPLFLRSLDSVWQFVTRSGGIIFGVTVVVWLLGYFPQNGDLSQSYLGVLGQWIQPALEPLGLDWKYGVAILTSFLAREVFVGTLGTLFEIENAEENFVGLVESVQRSGLSFASGMGLLVFYAIALQCASTFALLKSETGNYRYAVALLVGYGVLAYGLSALVFALL